MSQEFFDEIKRLKEVEKKYEALQKSKRPFSPEFSNQVINNQVKRIEDLETKCQKLLGENIQLTQQLQEEPDL